MSKTRITQLHGQGLMLFSRAFIFIFLLYIVSLSYPLSPSLNSLITFYDCVSCAVFGLTNSVSLDLIQNAEAKSRNLRALLQEVSEGVSHDESSRIELDNLDRLLQVIKNTLNSEEVKRIIERVRRILNKASDRA